ncbi:MAG: OsmC family protein [Thermoplasmata archaeon]|nr:OsmC family protein [Thermoplasmata archaeon]NIS11351.1 OsmC family protein [Thermoplasmata archaeon]NIT76381.1 OsmC family protein [Thermoplasmata archaeon]NIY02752.1 OsmC family peroxiredoxin [Thermoplasmata archaeon]
MGEEKRDRREFDFEMEWVDHLSFNVKWDFYDSPDLFLDEPPSMGGSGKGPNAARLAVAAVANCLSASLAFCLTKSRVGMEGMRVRCHGVLTRNERGRLRLAAVRIEPLVRMPADETAKLKRCLGIFEDFCIVTESVRKGIPVDVQVYRVDESGNETPV